MQLPRRFLVPAVGLLVAASAVACGTQSAPTTAAVGPSTASAPSAATAADPAARDAYSAAMCPLFTAILELDPRLAAMRDAGAAGGVMSSQGDEIDAVAGELLTLLGELEAVPEWSSGAALRHQLITALHAVRAQLLHVGGDPAATSAAGDLASLPFIASDAMDLAMGDAVEGGLTCEPTP